MQEKITLKKKLYIIGIVFFLTSLFLINDTNKEYAIKENEIDIKNAHVNVENYLKEIKEYSAYFNFDEDKMVQLVRKITNDYSSDYNLKIYGEEYTFDNPKDTSLMLIYDIYRTPKTYKIKKNDYITQNKVVKPKYKGNKIIINEEYKFSEYLGYISDLFNVDKSLALAISDYETGYQKSSLAKNKNNFGGLRGSSGYITYPTPQAGIICYVSNLKRIIYKNKITEITELSGIYVNGSRNKPSNSWINNITIMQNKINENKDKYFKI